YGTATVRERTGADVGTGFEVLGGSSRLPRLQVLQRVWRLDSLLEPPRESGRMWSMWRMMLGSWNGDAPQDWQRCSSRLRPFQRGELGMCGCGEGQGAGLRSWWRVILPS